MQCLQLTRGDPPSSPTKWYFNETITLPKKGTTWKIDFVFGSSSTIYTNLKVILVDDILTLKGTYYVYIGGKPMSADNKLYDDNEGWSKSSYRKITFSTPPTGDLLTWLKANAIPQ